MPTHDEPVADDATEIEPAAYMKGRVANQLRYYERAANKAKKTHVYVQTAVIVIGVFVPVIVNLPNRIGQFDISMEVRIAATATSLAVAILSGLSGFRKWGDLWLSFRLTEELLKQEKFLFLTRASRYAEDDGRFPRFVERVEAIVSTEHQKFRSVIEQARRPRKDS